MDFPSIAPIKEILRSISSKLYLYDAKEGENISFILIEKVLGISRMDLILNKEIEIPAYKKNILEESLTRLIKGEPIQYVIGEAFFYKRIFNVNHHVLIPRQETEELVEIIIQENKKINPLKILDICTGSGCIAISLQKEMLDSEVFALDVSEDALKIAKENATTLDAKITFLQKDILLKGLDDLPQELDIIVSNPPYVTENEKTLMHTNVLDFEPSLALFVKDNNPLLFYKEIAIKSFNLLKKEGSLYFEINEKFGKEIQTLLKDLNYSSVRILKDIKGKDRFVSCIKN